MSDSLQISDLPSIELGTQSSPRPMLSVNPERLRIQLEQSGWLGQAPISGYARCLMPLLDALGWRGTSRHVCEALPYFSPEIDRVDFINSLANLGFFSNHQTTSAAQIDERLFPCLFVQEQGGTETVFVLLEQRADHITCFSAEDDRVITRPASELGTGEAYFFSPLPEEPIFPSDPAISPWRWVWHLSERFRGIRLQIIITTFFLSLLALAPPLYIMTVYDKVIASRAPETQHLLMAGVLIALTMEAIFRFMRVRLLSWFGTRIDNIVSRAIFERLLFLPAKMTEGASVSAQIARLKDFDSVRDFFTGPVMITLLELPFIPISLLAIGLISGPLVLITLLIIICYGLLAFSLQPTIRRSIVAAAKGATKRQSLFVEIVTKMRALKIHAAGDTWLERYRQLSAEASLSNSHSAFHAAMMESFAYGLSVLAGLLTLVAGVYLIWAEMLSTGALIATMILTWRLLSPLQNTCTALSRLEQLRNSIRQVHRLLMMSPERDPRRIAHPLQDLQGTIRFSNTTLRYQSDRESVIAGLNLVIPAGEMLTITGENGAGKSSLLRLINGTYPPQAGSVLIDDTDIRQIDPVELRHEIAYISQKTDLFHGTIAQNLRMVAPIVSDEQLISALKRVDAWDEVQKLKGGLHHMIGDQRTQQLSATLTFKLNMARAFIRDTRILLIDEIPYPLLNSPFGEHFKRLLMELKGSRTIIMVTHREDYMRMGDRLLVLQTGGRAFAGKPDEIIEALKKAAK